jgi:hypothetical protein
MHLPRIGKLLGVLILLWMALVNHRGQSQQTRLELGLRLSGQDRGSRADILPGAGRWNNPKLLDQVQSPFSLTESRSTSIVFPRS